MNFTSSFSPAPLSYMAALRNVTPPAEQFAYAIVNCTAPHLLAAMAASNPNSRFYGLMNDTGASAAANEDARLRQVGNVTFLRATLNEALSLVGTPGSPLPPL